MVEIVVVVRILCRMAEWLAWWGGADPWGRFSRLIFVNLLLFFNCLLGSSCGTEMGISARLLRTIDGSF
ncbi:MAG: hypothetical protein ABTQ34_00940 [Bdellovibrionales bacterium]